MSAELPVCAYAVVGTGSEHAPPHRTVDVPPPGTKRRGGRLPLLASELAQLALERGEADEGTSVIFGSGLGCLTETQLFVEHMIEADEATPKPRAFSSSVHNAIGSKVALTIQARGECQTFVQAECSFPHAIFAATRVRGRRGSNPILIGAVDETCEYVERGLKECGSTTPASEGGGVLLFDPSRPPIARVMLLAMGRPRDPIGWVAQHVPDSAAIVDVPGLGVGCLGSPASPIISRPSLEGVHPSLTATLTALAIGIFTDEVDPAILGFTETPAEIALLSRTRFGDCALTHVAIPR